VLIKISANDAMKKGLRLEESAVMAEMMASMGFDGIEAPVRDGGHIEPARVEEELPKMVAALKERGLEITVLASSVSRCDEPHTEKVLRTAAKLGIRRYRLAHLKYDLERSVVVWVGQGRGRETIDRFFNEMLRMEKEMTGINHRISVPVAVLLAGHDEIVDNRAIEEWFKKLQSDNKAIKLFEDMHHVMPFEDDIEPLITFISDWIGVREASVEHQRVKN